MPILRNYSSIAQPTTLAGSISSGATSINVGATTGFPTSTPYTLALDYGAATEELVDVTAVAGTTLTVTRGVDGTSAQSHSLGANVRHVISARDLADYQAHQAATTAVHGVAGTLVGTSDTQTLGNKTLTSPTINAGALSGTLTGAPTLSGAVTFSGNPTFTGAPVFNGSSAPYFQRAAAANTALKATVTGDTQDRFQVNADGKILWGSGTAAQDVNLYRQQANVLGTDNIFRVIRSLAADNAISVRLASDSTASRFLMLGDGTASWGPGGTTATDTTLYRNGVGALKTDGSLEAGGNLIGANFTPGASVPYTCTWTAATTNPFLGNGTIFSYYSLRGKWCLVEITLAIGSTTTTGSGSWLFSLPFTAASRSVAYIGNAQALGSQRYLGQTVITSGATTTSPAFPTNSTTIAASLASSAVPFGAGNWGASDQCRMTFEYEIV